MPNLGPMELALVLLIVLFVFGPGRLPEVGGAIGRGIREFRQSVSGESPERTTEEREDARQE